MSFAASKFIAGLKHAFQQGELMFPGSLKHLGAATAFHAFLRPLFRRDWVVYAKRPFRGPQHVLQYLARYTHRVAISNHRIIHVGDGNVTFRWKNYAHKGKQKLMTLTAAEFLRRFLLHTLPRGFVRIRFSGFLANRRRWRILAFVSSVAENGPAAATHCHCSRSMHLALPKLWRPNGPYRKAHRSTDPLETCWAGKLL